MLIKRSTDLRWSDVTDRRLYLNRREFVRAAVAAGVAAAWPAAARAAQPAPHGRRFQRVRRSEYSTSEPPNPWEHVTTYNNFWEFGKEKDDPALHASTLKTEPWSILVTGACEKPATFALDDVLRMEALEERIYRHLCVEGWSIVVRSAWSRRNRPRHGTTPIPNCTASTPM